MKIKSQKTIMIIALIALGLAGLLIYYSQFKTITNEDILAHGWKGGVCESLPDVLDFRQGYMTLHEDNLYLGGKLAGHIVKREYRLYDDGYIEVRTETGELCSFWAKFKN